MLHSMWMQGVLDKCAELVACLAPNVFTCGWLDHLWKGSFMWRISV